MVELSTLDYYEPYLRLKRLGFKFVEGIYRQMETINQIDDNETSSILVAGKCYFIARNSTGIYRLYNRCMQHHS